MPPTDGRGSPQSERPRAPAVDLHEGVVADADAVSALAIQVFLDTYATDGVRPDLAREAFAEYSAERFGARLAEPGRDFVLARRGEGLVAFAEVLVGPVAVPGRDEEGAELVRLYVQPRFQREGLGARLLAEVERRVAARGGGLLWLTAWERNERALAFYRAHGYRDVGPATYEFEGRVYRNVVLSRSLDPAEDAA